MFKAVGDRTIPRPENQKFFYKDGDTADIATKVLLVYEANRDQVAAFASHLRGQTLYDTCRNVWHAVKDNIRYQLDPKDPLDPKGKKPLQYVRRPAQMWWSGVGDCKSYSVFIASCLYQLGIVGAFRFVSYTNQNIPTHVYVVVKNNGREIILDAVMPGFDEEKPYEYKNDFNMTRIYELSGIKAMGSTRRYTKAQLKAQSQISGGLSTALNKGARRQLFADSLPGLAMLALYQFIPGGSQGEFEKIVPGIATPDNLLAGMPQSVKDKRYLSFQSFWDFGDWADWKVETDVFPKVRAELKNQLGMDPTEWWRMVINTYCGKSTAYTAGVGFLEDAADNLVKTMLDKVKNMIGNLFGGSDFKWKRGAPDTWAPAVSDWSGYPCVPLNYLQVGKGVPVTGTGQVSWNDVINTNPPAQPPVPTTSLPKGPLPYTPPATPTNQPPLPPEEKDNTILYLGIAAVAALVILKK